MVAGASTPGPQQTGHQLQRIDGEGERKREEMRRRTWGLWPAGAACGGVPLWALMLRTLSVSEKIKCNSRFLKNQTTLNLIKFIQNNIYIYIIK